jgi:hypothetical protein
VGPLLLQLREGTDPLQLGLAAIIFGSVKVGETATKTLNIHNTILNPAEVYGCSQLIDVIPVPALPRPIENIDFGIPPYQIPGPMITFPPEAVVVAQAAPQPITLIPIW